MSSFNSLLRLRAMKWLLTATLAACAAPVLEKDTAYPEGWPNLVGALEECRGVEGTFANKGVYIDKAGQPREAWLTDMLPFEERVPEGDPRRKERGDMQSCERVSLQLESSPWKAVLGPDAKHWRLVVNPTRQVSGDPSARWESCGAFQLPRGLGWPLEGALAVTCAGNFFALTAEPGRVIGDLFALKLATASDGSLIAKMDIGPIGALEHVWARFARLP